MDLSRVNLRQGLSPRREPYWQRLGIGRTLGFRPSKAGSKGGTWIAKYYDPLSRRRSLHALGDYGELAPNERFAVAKHEAEAWFDHVGTGGAPKPITVGEACRRYAKGRPDADGRFRRFVYDDAIARIQLHKLGKAHLVAWRERLEATPALVTRRKKGEPVTRERSEASVNRDMVPLRAALNKAKDDGLVLTDTAWAAALRPIKSAGRRRNLYLDRLQRARLLEQLPTDLSAFVRALCLLPLRPGALAALTAGDFDARRSELVVSRDKAGEGRKILLPPQTAALLKVQARGKLAGARLFTQADGRSWGKDDWKWPLKDAARAAGLPAATTAYTLRHSTITDLVTGGLDLLTVAQVSGTSVAMIEKHYGHLQRDHAAAALATLAL